MDTIVRYNLYNVGEAAAVDVKLTDAGKNIWLIKIWFGEFICVSFNLYFILVRIP